MKEKHVDELKVLREYYEKGLKIKSFPNHIESPTKCHEFLNSCGMNISFEEMVVLINSKNYTKCFFKLVNHLYTRNAGMRKVRKSE